MVKRTGEGGSPDEYFGSVKITLEQPAERNSKHGRIVARYRAERVADDFCHEGGTTG